MTIRSSEDTIEDDNLKLKKEKKKLENNEVKHL